MVSTTKLSSSLNPTRSQDLLETNKKETNSAFKRITIVAKRVFSAIKDGILSNIGTKQQKFIYKLKMHSRAEFRLPVALSVSVEQHRAAASWLNGLHYPFVFNKILKSINQKFKTSFRGRLDLSKSKNSEIWGVTTA